MIGSVSSKKKALNSLSVFLEKLLQLTAIISQLLAWLSLFLWLFCHAVADHHLFEKMSLVGVVRTGCRTS